MFTTLKRGLERCVDTNGGCRDGACLRSCSLQLICQVCKCLQHLFKTLIDGPKTLIKLIFQRDETLIDGLKTLIHTVQTLIHTVQTLIHTIKTKLHTCDILLDYS